MNPRIIGLALLAVLLVIQPLLKFAASPSFEAARAVDLLLIFASGMMSGVLLTSVFRRKAAP